MGRDCLFARSSFVHGSVDKSSDEIVMQEYKPSPLFGFLVVVSVATGPFCLIVRGGSASRIEQLLYIVSLFPLGLLAIYVLYRERRSLLLHDRQSKSREDDLVCLKNEHKRIIVYGIGLAILLIVLLLDVFVSVPVRQ